VPQVAFLFGLQVLGIFVGFDGNASGVAFAHLLFVLPYVFLSLADPWEALDPRYIAVAASLGASPRRIFWRVRLPLLLAPVLTAAAVGFAVSIGLYLPTLLIGAGRVTTLTTEAVALASGGDRRLIGVFGLMQLAAPFAGFALALAIPALAWRNRRGLRVRR
jgi:putative thiamine transport system permease protein